MRAYSDDLRQRIFGDCDGGMTTRVAATKYRVSESWVRRLKQRRRQTGELSARCRKKFRTPVLAPHYDRIRALITDQPDLTLQELRATRLGRQPDGIVGNRPVLGLELEKKVLRAAEQDRPDVKEKRQQWRQRQPQFDRSKLVFIDETWASTNMSRRYGRCPKGQRLVCAIPYGHWKTTTFVGALRADGMTAPVVIDGAMNGDLFLAYIEQQLVPTLRPGDVVIMDNLPAHNASAYGPRLKRSVLPWNIYRRTVPTSIPSNWRSPNSNTCCAVPANAPWMGFGTSSVKRWRRSHPRNAKTTSAIAATRPLQLLRKGTKFDDSDHTDRHSKQPYSSEPRLLRPFGCVGG